MNQALALRQLLLAALLSAPAADARAVAGDDPLHSAACTQAMGRLTALERAALAPPPGAAPAPLLAARREAAVACLGAAALKQPPRVGQLREPVSVPAVRPTLPAVTAGAPATAVRVPSVVSVTACDANGCWASDGTRLTRNGPLLMGPQGACTTTGAVLNCP